MKEYTFISKFGLQNTVVIPMNNFRLFGEIKAVKFEENGVIKYDIQTKFLKMYDVPEHCIEEPSIHQDTTEIM